jgi:hypothetical protein
LLDFRDNVLFLAQRDNFIHVEELLAPFHKIWRVNYNLGAEMTIALLIRTFWCAKYILFLLQSADRVVLDWPRSQDTELPTIAMLLRGMRAPIVGDMHWAVSMTAIKGIGGLEGMAIWILQAQILVKHRVIVVEPGKVKAGLGREGMVS